MHENVDIHRASLLVYQCTASTALNQPIVAVAAQRYQPPPHRQTGCRCALRGRAELRTESCRHSRRLYSCRCHTVTYRTALHAGGYGALTDEL